MVVVVAGELGCALIDLKHICVEHRLRIQQGQVGLPRLRSLLAEPALVEHVRLRLKRAISMLFFLQFLLHLLDFGLFLGYELVHPINELLVLNFGLRRIPIRFEVAAQQMLAA